MMTSVEARALTNQNQAMRDALIEKEKREFDSIVQRHLTNISHGQGHEWS